MGETANIAIMAERVSDEIFAVFGWTKIGPMNLDWNCEQPSIHGGATHPADVVFYYEEPYENKRTVVHCDLKSYAADSISKTKIQDTLVSLSKQISCAEISGIWQQRYTLKDKDFNVAGLLFIYNHDGGYDRAFADTLLKIDLSKLHIPLNAKVAVFGPVEIHWLNNVAQEIMRMRGRSGRDKLPQQDECSFYYPQQINNIQLRGEKQYSATIELLTSPWLILHYNGQGGKKGGYIIFYREKGDTVEEFLYLIDFLRQQSLLNEVDLLTIKSFSSATSATNFDNARLIYRNQIMGPGSENTALGEAINSIKYAPINNLTSQFSEAEIGLSYDR